MLPQRGGMNVEMPIQPRRHFMKAATRLSFGPALALVAAFFLQQRSAMAQEWRQYPPGPSGTYTYADMTPFASAGNHFRATGYQYTTRIHVTDGGGVV